MKANDNARSSRGGCLAIWGSFTLDGLYVLSRFRRDIVLSHDGHDRRRSMPMVRIHRQRGGIAEDGGVPPQVRRITDPLDAVGQTTKDGNQGLCIGSARARRAECCSPTTHE